MNYQASLLVLIMILCSGPTNADKPTEGVNPSSELLEFLGEWETDSGDWIDPESFENEDFVNLMNMTDEENTQAARREVVSERPQTSQRATENE